MTLPSMEQDRSACSPMGQLEYVVESRCGGRMDRWFVVRPHHEAAPSYRAIGMALTPGCRVIVEARSLRPIGVLEGELPEPVPSPLGYNPYFDLPPV
ncbi:MAG: hypothetical protein ABI569_03235 [Casimicrobiaceae bacterium]